MENENLKHIYFTDDFRKDISSLSKSIEISSFRLGEYSSDVPRDEARENGTHTGIKYINYDYMRYYTTLPNGQTVSDRISPSSNEKAFNLDGVYDYENEVLYLYVIPRTTSGKLDEGLYDEGRYKILYVLYRNILTDIEKLAFVIYNEDIEVNSPTLVLNPLNLSKFNNLITIKIPFKCEVITYMDSDTLHLEGAGVNYMNYYSIPEDKYGNFYINKSSFNRYFSNTIMSDTPMIGGVTINKFGLKLY